MAFDIGDKYIKEAEEALRCSLPSAYKSIMKENNGGTIDIDGEYWEIFPIRDSSNRKRISRTCNHILLETGPYRKYKSFPDGALAIASDGSGNVLIFTKRDLNGFCAFSDEVYIWNHETGDVVKIADTFSNLKMI